MSHLSSIDGQLARSITWRASRHTYTTIQLLADRDRVLDAFRAYAYFRWVDDRIDLDRTTTTERLAFLARQADLLEAVYHNSPPEFAAPTEQMLIELIRRDPRPESGLASYLRNMMDVMRFDARRRGRWITQSELDGYTRSLALAVTEALHYFIGYARPAPRTPARTSAASAAHITHMLRDTNEDVAAGYYNIPRELLTAEGLAPSNLDHPVYRAWVQQRVAQARRGFELGRAYLAQVDSRRCRVAGFAYCARFEAVLDAIERNQYDLTAPLRPRSFLSSGRTWRTVAAALLSALPRPRPGPEALSEAAPRSRPPLPRADRSS